MYNREKKVLPVGKLQSSNIWVKPLVLAMGAILSSQASAQSDGSEGSRLESIVVTASRTEQRLGSIAASVEILDELDFQEISGTYLTDVLKKGSSVDIIEYPGGLSGVGLRGFRPEFSGTNKRVLILQDGRPAGFTSVGTAMRASVGRVEVLKGSASALYGSSAMGGVVNFISRRTEGDLQGTVSLGAGSFGTFNADARIGGSLTDRLSFDLSYAERTQDDDYDMGKESKIFGDFVQGGGATRPNTSFSHQSLYGRLSYDLNDDWRVEGQAHGYYSDDVYTPGGESAGVSNVGLKDIKGHAFDFSVQGTVGSHSLFARIYDSNEFDNSLDIDAGGYKNGDRETDYRGFQLQDRWDITDTFNLMYGIDKEEVSNETRRFNAAGDRTRPFSPNDERETWGAFAEATLTLMDERLILNGGLRYDEITARVLPTLLRPDLTPGESTVDTTNPRAGVVFYPVADGPIRLHGSAGTGFVTPLANQLAGFFDDMVGDQRRVTLGNPNLEPEESDSYDLGIGYESQLLGADLTWFRIDTKNKIESVFTTNTPTYRQTDYVNASTARAAGWELTLQGDLGGLFGGEEGRWTFDMTATYFTDRSQELPGGEEPVRNVARFKINASLSYAQGPFRARLGARHVDGMIDRDFSTGRIFTNGAGGQFEYPGFTVFDAFASWNIDDKQQLALQVDNLEDEYYYEKNDYPFAGRNYTLTYRYAF